MFDQMEKDRQIKNSIQASADDKLNNMIEGNKCNRLMFAENEPLSMVMFNDYKHVNAIQSYSEPGSWLGKKIVYENTRQHEGRIDKDYEAEILRQELLNSNPSKNKIDFSDVQSQSTPNILGQRKKRDQEDRINLDVYKKLKTEQSLEDRWYEGSENGGALKMPSPNPDEMEPFMTWGEIEGNPQQLNGPSYKMKLDELLAIKTDERIEASKLKKDEDYQFLIQRSSKEELAHELSNNLLRKKMNTSIESKKRDQVRNIQTPGSSKMYSRLATDNSVKSGSIATGRQGSSVMSRLGTLTDKLKSSRNQMLLDRKLPTDNSVKIGSIASARPSSSVVSKLVTLKDKEKTPRNQLLLDRKLLKNIHF